MLEIAKQFDDQGKGLSKTVADIKDANKRGALHFAAREGKTDVCKYLLEELKLDVDTQDEDGLCLMFLLCILRFVVLFFVHELVIALQIRYPCDFALTVGKRWYPFVFGSYFKTCVVFSYTLTIAADMLLSSFSFSSPYMYENLDVVVNSVTTIDMKLFDLIF